MSSYNQKLDQEISVKGIVYFVIGLTVVVVVSSAALWAGSLLLRNWEKAQDPPPPLLAEAREKYEPPAPRLQANPFTDIEELRAHEASVLGTYDWVDESAGVVHIPIDRAIELVAEGRWDLTPETAPLVESDATADGAVAEPAVTEAAGETE